MTHVLSTSLYARLGGYDGIFNLMEGVCGRMLRDGDLSTFFKGHNLQSKKQLQQQFINYVVTKTGGPNVYSGLEMQPAHHGLEISSSNWDTFRNLVLEAAHKRKVQRDLAEELLNLFETVRADIVMTTKPADKSS